MPQSGPFDPEHLAGALGSLGPHARASTELAAAGLVTPDVLCGQAVLLQARQPHSASADPAQASPIAGGVWVREQCTIHRPMRADEVFAVTGATVRRYMRRGRRYDVTVAETRDHDGALLVANCTTGLLAYAVEGSLDDSQEGAGVDAVPVPVPDPTRSSENPERPRLTRLVVGDAVACRAVTLELDWMVRRDGRRPMNPIHSDPEVARRAGLRAPIAGGSHVAAFVLEALMAAWGPHCLLHGAYLDLRWLSPTEAGTELRPTAVVERVDANVEVAIAIDGADGIRRLQGRICIPVGEL